MLPWVMIFRGYRYGFNGMEKDDEIKGGNSYDFGARIYDSRVGRWLALDPLAHIQPFISSYCAFNDNPVYYIDPDGKKVKPGNLEALQVIKNTLPEDAREYLVLDSDGYIDKAILKRYANSGGSENFKTLVNLVDHSEVIEVHLVTGDYHMKNGVTPDGTEFEFDPIKFGEVREMTPEEKEKGLGGDKDYNLTTNEGTDNTLGVTLEKNWTISGNREVLINGNLSEQGKVEVGAHELYGHAGMSVEKSGQQFHDFSEHEDENIELKFKILTSVKEAIKNYKGNKKEEPTNGEKTKYEKWKESGRKKE